MSEKVTAMIEEIKGLTVLELSELVHALEEEFGVSAAAMAAPAAGGAAPAAEEKTEFDGTNAPASWKHYGIYTQNQIIDIVAPSEPTVRTSF